MELYSLANRDGIAIDVAGYGGSIVSLRVPDRSGNMGDIVLGFDSLEEYQRHPYFGALIGRYCNRIANARFELQGVEFRLARNSRRHSLHGGWRGFDKVLWNMRDVSTPDNPALELAYRSPNGEEGYPGNLDITVTYSLPADNELRIDYQARTDKDTVVNLTSHSYFNLSGHGEGDVLGHLLEIAADRFTVVDEGRIPTGELRSVTGTPFDFRRPIPIGARIAENHEQLSYGNGYDHNFVLSGSVGLLRLAARVADPLSGRVMEVLTTEPGVHFYTGNALQDGLRGKSGKVYGPRTGFCLETQHFPGSPNQPAFPSTILTPSEPFHSTTVYRFTPGSDIIRKEDHHASPDFCGVICGAIAIVNAQAPTKQAKQAPDPRSLVLVGDRFKPLKYDEMTREQKTMVDHLLAGERGAYEVRSTSCCAVPKWAIWARNSVARCVSALVCRLVYALVVDKGGLKMKPSAGAELAAGTRVLESLSEKRVGPHLDSYQHAGRSLEE